jgi:hypothetical protein
MGTNNGSWRVVEHSRNVHSIRFDEIAKGWEQFVLLQSDEHWDNPHCDSALYRKHLDEAKARNAPVIKYGDLFCAMQGKYDKRACKDSIRPEHQHGNYLDALVRTAAEFHAPYADILTVTGPGNHETSILKHCETNLTERFVEAVKARSQASQICMGGFSGWVRFQFSRGARFQQSVRLWYHHGYGGGGPVTRDVIQSARRAVYVDADIVCTGHTHDEWILPVTKLRLNVRNQVEKFDQLHIKTPGYKDEYADGASGWHIERGGPPKPIGAIWLRFYYEAERIRFEARRAQ